MINWIALTHYIRAVNAYRVHSPAVYHFCEEVLDNELQYYALFEQKMNSANSPLAIPDSWFELAFKISLWYKSDAHCFSDNVASWCNHLWESAQAKSKRFSLSGVLPPWPQNKSERNNDLSSIEESQGLENRSRRFGFGSLIEESQPFIDECLKYFEGFPSRIWIFWGIHSSSKNYRIWNSLSDFSVQCQYIEIPDIGILWEDEIFMESKKWMLCAVKQKPFLFW